MTKQELEAHVERPLDELLTVEERSAKLQTGETL